MKQFPPSPFKKLTRLYPILIIIIVCVLIIVSVNWLLKKRKDALDTYNPWTEPVAVETIQAKQGDLKLYLNAIGTVIPTSTVTVQSRVSGQLLQIFYHEGQLVQQGQLLAQIDPSQYQIALQQAQANYQKELAELNNAKIDLQRYQKLFADKAISKQVLDTQVALVKKLTGSTLADQSQIKEAQLKLDWTRITSPLAGRVGFKLIDPGNQITLGNNQGIVNITQVSPIQVEFSIPEQKVPLLRQQLAKNLKLTVYARNEEDNKTITQGVLRTLDNQIDLMTGTLRIKAEFSNQDDALYPNQFVNIQVHIQTLTNVLLIPNDAIQYNNDGAYVYTIHADDQTHAHLQSIKLGQTDGKLTEIQHGLKSNDKIVLQGLDRLREGQEIKIVSDNKVQQKQQTAS